MDKASGAYRTISEVAEELDIPQHVLRFWETRFPQIKPMKRSGGRRYYRPADVLLLRGIRRLLYGEGYTIKGVQRILAAQGIGVVQQAGGASGTELSAVGDIEGVEAPGGRLPEEEISVDFVAEPEEAPQRLFADDAEGPVPVRAMALADARQGLDAPVRLPANQRRLLQGALSELAECARLLSALQEGDGHRPA